MLWCLFNNKGQLIYVTNTGNVPNAGTNSFDIFATFIGLNVGELGDYTGGSIKFYKPDLHNSSYLPLNMVPTEKVYDGDDVEDLLINGYTYKGLYFNFENYDDTVLLDTAGLWRAVITLLHVSGASIRNVVGSITFEVGAGNETPEGNELSLEDLLNGLYTELDNKLNQNSRFYLKVVDSVATTEFGDSYNIGDFVLDRTDKKLYKLNESKEPVLTDLQISKLSVLSELLLFGGEFKIYLEDNDILHITDEENLDISWAKSTGLLNISTTSLKWNNKDIATEEYVDDVDKYIFNMNSGTEYVYGLDLEYLVNNPNARIRYGQFLYERAYEIKSSGRIITVIFVSANEEIHTDNETKVQTVSIPRIFINAVTGKVLVNNISKSFYSASTINEKLDLKADLTYVNQLVEDIKANSFIIVDSRVYPTLQDFLNNYPLDQREEGNIYLYPIDPTDLNGGYKQYIWEGNDWVYLGNLTVDLSDYYTKGETRNVIPKYQTNVAVILDPLTNINGRYLSAFSYGYDSILHRYQILKNEASISKEEAENYMEFMCGSRYVPEFNYEKPVNTYWLMANGTFLKPQYDNMYGMLLYEMTSPFALKTSVPNNKNLENGTGTNALQQKGNTASGKDSFAQGLGNTASNIQTHAEGFTTQAVGNFAHSEGQYTVAHADISHTEGVGNVVGDLTQVAVRDRGQGGHAEGLANLVLGQYAHAEGANNVAKGDYSHANGIGGNDWANPQNSEIAITEFDEVNYIKNTSVGHGISYDSTNNITYFSGARFGDGTQTFSEFVSRLNANSTVKVIHSSGTEQELTVYNKGTDYFYLSGKVEWLSGDSYLSVEFKQADGDVASGTAYGTASYVGGFHNVAMQDYQTVVGKYNQNKFNTLFEVGNGADNTHRSNAFEVYLDGHAEVGLMGSTNKSVATKGYVDTKFADFEKESYKVVDTVEYPTLSNFLASTGAEGYLYLYPIDTSDLTKGYYRYIWENAAWLSLGTTEIDLNNYVTTNTDQTISGVKTIENTSGLKLKYPGISVNWKLRGGDIFEISKDGVIFANLNTGASEIRSNIIPMTNDLVNLGSFLKNWKDLYLSGKINIGSNEITTDTYNNLILGKGSGLDIAAKGNLKPNSNNTYNLGSGSNNWKDLYISGRFIVGQGSKVISVTEIFDSIWNTQNAVASGDMLEATQFNTINSDTNVSVDNKYTGYEELKGLFVNTHTTNSIVVTFLRGLKGFLCNDDNIVFNGTDQITIPANTSIEFSIVNGFMCAVNFDA